MLHPAGVLYYRVPRSGLQQFARLAINSNEQHPAHQRFQQRQQQQQQQQDTHKTPNTQRVEAEADPTLMSQEQWKERVIVELDSAIRQVGTDPHDDTASADVDVGVDTTPSPSPCHCQLPSPCCS